MADQKNKAPKDNKNTKLNEANDQLGENSGEGRFFKSNKKTVKNADGK